MNEWKQIPGFGDRYEISDDGVVRSYYVGRRSGTVRRAQPYILLQHDNRGYRNVGLTTDGKQRTCPVHRLVLLAFVGPPPFPEAHAAHENGVRHDNRLANLSWKTPKANQDDRKRHGTHLCGEKTPSAKLTTEQVHAIRALSEIGWPNKRIAGVFAITASHVGDICSGRARVIAPEERFQWRKST